MKRKLKKLQTKEVYTLPMSQAEAFLKKANSYLDEDEEPIAQVEITDYDLVEEGVDVEIEVDFVDDIKAKEDFDEWFENVLEEGLVYADVEEVTEY